MMCVLVCGCLEKAVVACAWANQPAAGMLLVVLRRDCSCHDSFNAVLLFVAYLWFVWWYVVVCDVITLL
jgi:hypothetical protein